MLATRCAELRVLLFVVAGSVWVLTGPSDSALSSAVVLGALLVLVALAAIEFALPRSVVAPSAQYRSDAGGLARQADPDAPGQVQPRAPGGSLKA